MFDDILDWPETKDDTIIELEEELEEEPEVEPCPCGVPPEDDCDCEECDDDCNICGG